MIKDSSLLLLHKSAFVYTKSIHECIDIVNT